MFSLSEEVFNKNLAQILPCFPRPQETKKALNFYSGVSIAFVKA